MIEKRYQELCKVFDRILKKVPTPEIIANNYLHIFNLDPESLAKYDASKIKNFWLSIKFRLVAVIRIFHSICDRSYYFGREQNIRSDVLFVSHITNNQQLLQDNDAYFGCLPEKLLKKGVNSSIALIMHNKINSKKVPNKFVDSKIPRFLLSSSLDFLSEIKLFLSQGKSKKQFRSYLKNFQVDNKLAKDILRHHLSPGTIQANRIAIQVARIVNETESKFLITTFEGHPWERLVYYHARKINPNIKCFGYQHAAVFKYQHAIKRPLGREYDPDVVFTSGLIAKDILNKSPMRDRKIVCIGSPKHLSNAIMTNKKKTCLVVPEGLISECLILFKLSLTYAKHYKDQQFIWRLHPLVSFDNLRKHNDIYNHLPNNIYLSNDHLDEDIKKCDSVLYRGSTAVVKAINAGLKPIYYQQNAHELSVDSIYQQKQGKEIVHNQKELNLALNKNIDMKTKKVLQVFAQDFYTPLDTEILLNEIRGQNE